MTSASIPQRDIARELLATLDDEQLTCIQFKSTRGLAESFRGETDFDLLVQPGQLNRIMDAAAQLGFFVRTTTNPHHPPEVIDLVGWCPNTDRTYHFSLHTELVFGSKPLKQFILPREIWQTYPPVRHPTFPIHVVDPSFEAALLALRLLLRADVRVRRVIRSAAARMSPFPESGMVEELLALASSLAEDEIVAAADALAQGSADAVRVALGCCQGRAPSWRDIRRARRSVLRAVEPYRVVPRAVATLRLLRTRLSRQGIVRSPSGGGAVIAVIGPDGAGKTTLTVELTNWLNYKLTAERFYLGRPKDDPLLHALGSARHVVVMTRSGVGVRSIDALIALRVAWVKRKAVRSVYRLRASGVIAVTDRYPLVEFHEMDLPMDGPRLNERTCIGRVERSLFRHLPQNPDLLVILDVGADTALERKPSDGGERHIHAKSDAVHRLAVSRQAALVIDRTTDAGATLRRVKEVVVDRLF